MSSPLNILLWRAIILLSITPCGAMHLTHLMPQHPRPTTLLTPLLTSTVCPCTTVQRDTLLCWVRYPTVHAVRPRPPTPPVRYHFRSLFLSKHSTIANATAATCTASLYIPSSLPSNPPLQNSPPSSAKITTHLSG